MSYNGIVFEPFDKAAMTKDLRKVVDIHWNDFFGIIEKMERVEPDVDCVPSNEWIELEKELIVSAALSQRQICDSITPHIARDINPPEIEDMMWEVLLTEKIYMNNGRTERLNRMSRYTENVNALLFALEAS